MGPDELDLTHRRHLFGAVFAVSRTGLDEHRRANLVYAVDIGRQVREQVLLVVHRFGLGDSEMTVGVAEGQGCRESAENGSAKTSHPEPVEEGLHERMVRAEMGGSTSSP